MAVGGTAVRFLAALALLVLTVAPVILAATIEYNFTVRATTKAIDGYRKTVYVINDQFPGPTIVVEQGDRLVVNLFNDLPSDAVAIHWHGIEHRGSPWQDGTASVSQCPATRGPFRYDFLIDQDPGTFWYHDHLGALRQDGLVGALIVNPTGGLTASYLGVPDESFAGDMIFMLHGWMYDTADWVLAGIDGSPFKIYPAADSILINGNGIANCSATRSPIVYQNGAPRCNSTGLDYRQYNVTAGKVYMLRIINTDAAASFQFAVQGHSLTVIAADGRRVNPQVVSDVFLHAGQRYTVLLTADQPVDSYWITARAWDTGHNNQAVTGHAYLHYEGAQNLRPAGDKYVPPLSVFDPRALTSLAAVPPKVQAVLPTRTIEIDAMPTTIPDSVTGLTQNRFRVQGKINRDWMFGAPMLAAAYLFPNDTYLLDDLWKTFSVQRLRAGEVIDLIIYSWPDTPTGNAGTHPWHLHGYHFWVLGQGSGWFNRTAAMADGLLNLVNPVRRDTIAVVPDPAKQHSESHIGPANFTGPAAWTLIRFLAGNPGVWPLHCHKLWHQLMLQTTFFVTDPERIPPPPPEHPRCKSWVGWEQERAVAAAVAATKASSTASFERQDNTDTSGAHVAATLQVPDKDPLRCLNACLGNPLCFYATYYKSFCYLKGASGGFAQPLQGQPDRISFKITRN